MSRAASDGKKFGYMGSRDCGPGRDSVVPAVTKAKMSIRTYKGVRTLERLERKFSYDNNNK
jgi:hypothetical protein